MQIGSVTDDDLVQIVTLIMCVIGIVAWLIWGRKRLGYALTPISFLIHRAIFYIALMVDPAMPNQQVVIWSSAISLHSVITVTSAAVLMIAASHHWIRP